MTYNPAAAAFQGVADLIGNGAPPAFLATVLAEAGGGIAMAARSEKDTPSAEEMRDRLEQVNKAARVLARYLVEPNTFGRLDKVPPQPSGNLKSLDLYGKVEWLRDLAKLSDAAKAAVKAEDGNKAWPTPEGLTAAELCALVVARLWHAVRDKPAGPQSGKVWAACDAMWAACGQEPLGMDGDVWRRRLEQAGLLLSDPALATRGTANSPKAKLRGDAVAFSNGLAERLVSYAQEESRRTRVAEVRAKAARFGLKH